MKIKVTVFITICLCVSYVSFAHSEESVNSASVKDQSMSVSALEAVLQKKEESTSKELYRQEEALYQQAMLLFRQGNYSEAKKIFIKLGRVAPNYKDSDRIVALIDSRL